MNNGIVRINIQPRLYVVTVTELLRWDHLPAIREWSAISLDVNSVMDDSPHLYYQDTVPQIITCEGLMLIRGNVHGVFANNPPNYVFSERTPAYILDIFCYDRLQDVPEGISTRLRAHYYDQESNSYHLETKE